MPEQLDANPDFLDIALRESMPVTAVVRPLPAIVRATDFMAAPIEFPPELVHGLIHRGSKGVYGAPSKGMKTWMMLHVCTAVASGESWLGFKTTKSRALYINFELQEFAVHSRLRAVCQEMKTDIPESLDLWNLRGHSMPLNRLIPELLRQISGEGYGLIVPDPIYKTLQGRDENSAGAVGEVCNEIEAVAVETGAAVWFATHFAKGNPSSKEAIDRISGSGVWARDPDTIITATKLETEGAFALDFICRNFSQPPPIAVRWQYPLMRRDDSLDPKDLKKPKSGRGKEYTSADILDVLGRQTLRTSEWLKQCDEERGIKGNTFYRLLKEAEKTNDIQRERGFWHRRL